MATAVRGYMTTDGHFFTTKSEAEFYEAEQVLLASLKANKVDPERFLTAFDAVKEELQRYARAKDAINSPVANKSNKANGDQRTPSVVE